MGTQDAFINCYVESKFELSRFYRLLIISKSILICQNSRTKALVLRARAKSQLQCPFKTFIFHIGLDKIFAFL